MKEGAHAALAAAARFYTPLIALFAFTRLVEHGPGSAIGLSAGVILLLAFVLYALLYGVAAARKAAPPPVLRVLTAAGLATAALGALGGVPLARELIEAGLFTVTAAGGALTVLVLFGRAPTMRDAAL